MIKSTPSLFFLLLIFSITTIVTAQNEKEKQKIISSTNVTALNNLSTILKKDFYKLQKKADSLAVIFNWEKIIKNDTQYSELVAVTEDNKPIYYSTYNNGAGITTRANKLYTGGGLGLSIHGEDMLAGIWDAGSARPSHELFSGRLQVIDGTVNTHYHAAHVAGTVIGTGAVQNGEARGMAFNANGHSYDWNNDVAEIAEAAANGLLLSNHSYGYNPNYISLFQWGKYDLKARSVDEVMFNAPFYQFVCAAGNSRNGGFNTAKQGFDLLLGHAVSKNSIVVAAVNEVLNYTGPGSVVMSNFSSWGPTDDGRIKPDISAKGVNTFSATDNSDTSYNTISGTSMASPSVTGTLLLLQQYYNQENNDFLKAATLKGLMIHTADEAGTSPGPDYKFGWGLINAEKAAEVITKKNVQSYILENTLSNNQTYTIQVNSIGNEPLIATLTWTDPAGILPSNTIDVATPALVNDLDIRITKATNVFFPWKLNPANPSLAAVNQDNIVDNVEKIEINNPTGSYIITITHKGTLQNLIQNYSLVVSGVTVKDFWMTSNQNLSSICQGIDNTNFLLNLHTKSNFSDTVVFSALDLPPGVTAVFSPTSMTTAGTFSVNFSGLDNLQPGEYDIIIRSESENEFNDLPIKIIIYSPNLSTVNLEIPFNSSQNNSITNPILFEWENITNAQEYLIEIANDNLFNNIIISEVVTINEFSASNLLNSTVYYWRVKPINFCGEGSFSSIFSFSTSCSISMINLMQTDATINSATIQWTDNNATSWEIEIVPEGVAPTGLGTLVSTNPFTINQLSSNSCYTIYIRSLCLVGFTEWLSVDVCTQPDYCGGDLFYDTGGANGNYQNNEYWTETIYPQDADHRVKAIFNSYAVESCCDYLRIHNGPNTTFPLLFNGGGTSPGTVVSTHPTGSLTFRFTSNGGVTSAGWNATILCEEKPPCNIPPSDLTVINKTYTTLSISWLENNNSTSWEVEIVPLNNAPSGNGIVVNTNTFTFTNLIVSTCYNIYVRSLCTEGVSEWINIQGCTQADYCGGELFYDKGGLSGNYQNNENWIETIYPQDANHRIRATFNSYTVQNYDYLKIYNGPDTTFPLLFNGGSASPGSVVSTHPTGVLTFRFTSNGAVTASGWAANIICEEIPTCDISPSDLLIISATETTMSITWNENSDSSSWEIEIVPINTTPTGNGFVVSSNTHTFSDLPILTCFDIYVRSLCAEGGSEWINAEGCTQANYCGGELFLDSGGISENYQNNENWTETIYPQDADHRIKAIFNSYFVQSCCDHLKIYNGPNSTFPILFNGGENSPGTIVSTHPTGSLTFKFTSNNSVTSIGWNATIICEEMPPCPILPSNLVITATTNNFLAVSWVENGDATSWEVEIVPQNNTPSGFGNIVSSNSFTFTNLNTSTCYNIYIRSICSEGVSEWVNIDGCTSKNYCGGDLFYDTGGANGNYQNNENWTETIYPQDADHRIRAIFNSYTVQNNDYLKIYNGPDTTFPLLFNGGIASPETVVSTHPSGALTFKFNSSNIVTASGWTATIICEEAPVCAISPSNLIVSEITGTELTITWNDSSDATSWEIEILPLNTIPTFNGIVVSSNNYTFSNLPSLSCFDIYVRSLCAEGGSEWINIEGCTSANYCGGDLFYDTGGANGNYQNNENWTETIYPQDANQRIRAIFNSYTVQNNDYLKIYNGPDTTFPLLFNGESTSPGTVVSTHPTGALTFSFTSDYFATNSGWNATIICEEMPPCPILPSNLVITSATNNFISISWIDDSDATSWEIEIVPQNTTPSGFGNVVSSNTYTFTNLNTFTCFDIYVRSLCTEGESEWISIEGCTSKNYCAGDLFYDTGGANGNYQNNENWTETIYPQDADHRIRAIFNSYSVESCCDYLRIYNGPNTTFPLLFNGGSTSPGIVVSTHPTGALTFRFTSDNSETASGWNAFIICEALPTCANPPSNLILSDVTSNSMSISWIENSDSTSWEIEIVPSNTVPSGNGIIVSNNNYTFSNLPSLSCFDIYVRSLCTEGESEWINIDGCTSKNYCGGDLFYDTGGANGNYQNNENWTETIYPQDADHRIKAIFNSYSVESCCDYLRIYNGPNTTFPLLFNGGSASPGTVVSTHPTGALTFRFTSDNSYSASGWIAYIICEELPTCANPPSNLILSDVTTNSMSFSWIENNDSTSWEIEIVPSNTAPSGNGVVVSNNNYTFSNLQPLSCFNIYVRSLCAEGESEWINIEACTLIDYCGGDLFYDTGGANGNYQNNEDWTETIYPQDADHRIRAIFNSYSVDSFFDFLRIYDGPNTTSPQIFYGGSISPGIVVSTHPTGALTFRFTSNSSVTGSGWSAFIICEEPPTCSNPPSNLILNDVTDNSLSISWYENSDSTSWEIEIVPLNTAPSGNGIVISNNNYTFSNLPSLSCFDIYVRSLCTEGESEWINIEGCTLTDYCGGDLFYDTGGANGNYQNNENWTETIYPQDTDHRIRAIFNSYSVESCCDFLRIYDGPNTTSPLLFNGGSASPETVVSTHPTGSLTFRFTSNSSGTESGWDATIICESTLSLENPESIDELKFYPIPVANELNIVSKVIINNYKIYDYLGRVISSKNVSQDTFSIPFDDYASGMYIIILEDNGSHIKNISVIKK